MDSLQLSPAAAALMTPQAFANYGDLSLIGDLPAEPDLHLFFPDGVTDPSMAACCLSGLWLLHNHLDRSHSISQDVATAEGSFWHAIMHRMEGDYWNSKYWFRRVGRHDCFNDIVNRLHDDSELSVAECDFVVAREWDPAGFVDFCERADQDAGNDLRWIKNRVATCEWRALFEYCWNHAHA